MSKGDRTRQRILDTARRMLESGETALSMGAIAAEAGVTRQLLYVRFAGRAQLVLELSRSIDAQVRGSARQAAVDTAPDARAALRETVALQGEIKPRISAITAVMSRLRPVDADIDAAWREREAARLSRCRQVADRLAEEGLLAAPWSPQVAARVIWSATSQRAWEELVQEGEWDTRAWVRHTTAMLESSLLGVVAEAG